ncbi:MAG: protein-L-isoaspartate(D-aspartate) O-methyltransferase [Candidatus Methanomethylicus sp.]|nr:protein-L-isoaspartate(D-aspartate) O-methyltransferase [Candidatus Methanomethylicus sp.]
MDSFASRRNGLVENLRQAGFLKKKEVIAALLKVPREEFIPIGLKDSAYADSPLPSFDGQTISAPHMVAIMCELLDLKPGQIVLEVGAGTGYHAAVCAEIVAPSNLPEPLWGHVFAIERISSLVEFASHNLQECGYDNRVSIFKGDGTMGLKERSPFDRILVTAAAPRIPPPLMMQLKDGGKMVIPVGEVFSVQNLILLVRNSEEFKETAYGGCVFVPLYGKYGWD